MCFRAIRPQNKKNIPEKSIKTLQNGLKHKKNNKIFNHNMTPPHPHINTQWAKSWSNGDFKMAANENALTQPKFDIGICSLQN